jgi:F-type H+-transporting ATPase subunit b
MLTSLLTFAEITSHAAEATGPTKIMQDFGISVPGILAQVLNVGIVVFILWKFAFKPVLATLDERQQKIASGLAYADEMKAKLAAAQEESAASAKRAQLEATRIIEEARKSAKDFLDKQSAETAARANDILAKAQQAIELEKKKMLAEARTEIARLVVVTTQRVLAKELSDADRSRYNDAATRELTSA